MDTYKLDNIVPLYDEDGNEIEFEIVSEVLYKGIKYCVVWSEDTDAMAVVSKTSGEYSVDLEQYRRMVEQYGKAAADGYDIRLDAAGHLTAVPDSELFTEGVLWLLTQQELYLLEEYKNGTEDRFVKRSVIVTAGDELLSAHTYLSRNVKDRPDRPDGQYYDALEAAREASLSEPYISRMVRLEEI